MRLLKFILFSPVMQKNIDHLSIKAFTLIELSIVIVIIGLLVGGVLMGRDLIASSAIRAQISQIEEFKTATNSFKVKYGYLPGDMPSSEASQLGFFTFTGTYAGKSCGMFAYGNNDGIVNSNTEAFAFFTHLSDAKMIKGSYGGQAGNLLTANTTGCSSDAGSPISFPVTTSDWELFLPTAKITTGLQVSFVGNFPLSPDKGIFFYSGTGKNNLFSISDSTGGTGGITPNQAYSIDIKIDDGFPTSGDVRNSGTTDNYGGIVSYSPCTTSSGTPLKYDLTPATADTSVCRAGISFLF